MQDKTSNHAPIPTELNIAPRGKSWLHGQLIDGEHGHPTRQSMESAESAQPIKAPAAVAVPDAVRDAEKLLRAEAARLDRIYGAGKWYGFSAEKASHLEHLRVADALAATPAAAPVVLPEPVAYSLGLAKYAHSSNIIAANEFTPDAEHADEWENLYTEEQLRALLATATGLPAQADTPDSFREWFAKNYPADTIIVDPDWHAKSIFRMAQAHARLAAPQAQADERDADVMYYLQDARWSAMVGNCPSFWRSGGGYTTSLDDAERFTLEAAMKQHKCRETDLPWLCSELDKLRRPTVDCQYMPRSWDAQRAAIAAQAATKEGAQKG
ncbi:hypothetical protein P245_27965 [Comamonas thiooxydans]|uniref:Uncharacterized protein n=1 Tax=Comamonas thiooxydans TaxID=363952 RepID=A0A0E3BU07_9BURK|nr:MULTISPECIES: hypothetical protein [Comamonas]KGG81899.1 hypothetical protein P245_27965 [Comamonas thiooxydans]GAO73244.1 LPS-assembly protein LptD [Comamonas sp. E6]